MQMRIATVSAGELLPGDMVPYPLPGAPDHMVPVMYPPRVRTMENGFPIVDVTVRLKWGAFTTVFNTRERFTVVR